MGSRGILIHLMLKPQWVLGDSDPGTADTPIEFRSSLGLSCSTPYFAIKSAVLPRVMTRAR